MRKGSGLGRIAHFFPWFDEDADSDSVAAWSLEPAVRRPEALGGEVSAAASSEVAGAIPCTTRARQQRIADVVDQDQNLQRVDGPRFDGSHAAAGERPRMAQARAISDIEPSSAIGRRSRTRSLRAERRSSLRDIA